MAREYAIEPSGIESGGDIETGDGIESNASAEASGVETPAGIEVPCPACERRWECDRADEPTCPRCGASFSVRVRDRFALVEREGWTVAVAFEAATEATRTDVTSPGTEATTETDEAVERRLPGDG
ncbi:MULTISPECIES: hypothetical protein [Halorussus]|uniref:hypothetical protein n=1 Tax=Halorussus TaxID=1070314 RepID=UPI00209E2C78|nr:hypothetical protein [Halorussus vallis]USZ75149.1 hypothetical protein NGM07_17160 [Halorussus vallis]